MAKTATLQDDFNSGTADSSKWTVIDGDGTNAQTGGQLVFTIAASDPSYVYDLYTSVNTYDLTGSYAQIEVPQLVNPFMGTEQKFNLVLDSNNQIQFINDGTYLVLDLKTAGVSSVTYVDPRPVTDHWWRIRESGGTIYWDSSKDGNIWVNRKVQQRRSLLPHSTMLSPPVPGKALLTPGSLNLTISTSRVPPGPAAAYQAIIRSVWKICILYFQLT